MIVSIMCIINIIFIFLLSSVILEDKNLLKIITLTLSFFYIEYLAISSFYLYFDFFQVENTLYVMTILNAVCSIIAFKKAIQLLANARINWKETSIILIFIMPALLFCNVKNEQYRIGSDEGLYLEKALDLNQEEASYISALDEYGLISSSVDEGLLSLQNEQGGLYTSYQDSTKLLYEYHALPLWPTFIALFMKILGVFQGGHALSATFLIAILTGYFCIEKTSSYPKSKYLIFPLFAFLPLSLYLAKATLSEMSFVALLFCGYFFLLERGLRNFAFLPFGLLGFLHISSVMYLPFIIILLFLASIIKKDKAYGVVNIGSSILYLCSLAYANKVSNLYTSHIFSNDLKNANLIYIVEFCFILVIILQSVAIVHMQKASWNICVLAKLWDKYHTKVFRAAIFILIFLTIYQGYQLGFTDKYILGSGAWRFRIDYANQGFKSLSRLNIISIFMATSYVCIPFITYKLFSNKHKFDYIESGLMILFLVSMVIYTAIRCDTPFNYYGSRYFMMMIVPSVLFLSAKLVQNQKEFIILSAIATITALPFSCALIPMSSHGGLVQLYKDISKAVGNNSVVLLDKDAPLMARQANNFRILNKNKVFEIDNYEEVSDFYGNESCYIVISNETANSADFSNNIPADLKLKNTYRIMGDIANLGAMYPLTQSYQDLEIEVLKILKEQLEYKMGNEENFDILGFHGNEGTFRWTTDKSSITTTLNSNNSYKMILVLKGNIPLDKLSRESLSFSILINDISIGTFELKKGDSQTVFEINIDKEILNEGISHNTVTILSEVWQPSEYGSQDQRYLGIPVQKIIFERTED